MGSPFRQFKGPGGVLPVRDDDVAANDLLMLIEGETSGRPLSEVLEEFGRSRSSYYEKLRRFEELGLEGLFTRPPGPRRPWVRTMAMMQAVVRARLHDPTKSAATIAEELKRAGHDVSVRSVERVLGEFSLSMERGDR